MVKDFALADLLVWYVVFVFSTTFHEFSHSVVAYFGGDRTAYEGGQVSLDPMPHIRREPMGLVIVPLITFALSSGGWMIGWASAPFDPKWAATHPRRYSGMSLAGPMANLFLAAVAYLLIVIGLNVGMFELSFTGHLDEVIRAADGQQSLWGAAAKGLSVLLGLNILLGVFNLMPVPPLDGAAVLEGLSPRTFGVFFARVRRTPGFGFLGLIIAWNLFPMVGWPAWRFVRTMLLTR